MKTLFLSRFQIICLILVVVMMLLGSWQSLHFQSYLLHQIGTVIMLMTLLYYHWRIGLSNWAFGLYNLGFLALHIFAAHYLYSYVPYNEWLINDFNFDLNLFFGWQRNMFDRLIHFCYGLLLYPFFFAVTRFYFAELKSSKWHFLVILWVMASSMFYELIEWWIALALSPEQAENYNGQQGDMWDAHKDMLLASVGAILAWLIFVLRGKFNRI